MATEKRLIYLEDVRNSLYEADAITMKGVAIINQFHTVDAVEVVHGRWIEYKHFMECSECHSNWWYDDNDCHLFDYCPNCGAKMDL